MTGTASDQSALHLVLGEEELLVERAVRRVLHAAQVISPTADMTKARATDLSTAELHELTTPSLFSDGRVVVIEGAHEASQDFCDALLAYVAQPADDVVLVVVHSGGGRAKAAKALPAALRKAGARLVECAKITKPAERETFVRDEVHRAGGRIDATSVRALIEAVGTDLRELASAAGQLVADTDGTIDEQAVRRYHRGRAEVTGFLVADKVAAGDQVGALEALRWALQIGVPHVLIADALADSIRTIAKVAAAGRGNPNQLAGELGLPPWKVRKAQTQTRGWAGGGLVHAMGTVARLNAEVKGAAASPDYAVERAVLELVAAKNKRS